DIRKLEKFEDKFDDNFATGNTEIVQLASQLIEVRVNQVMGFYGELLDKPFDFTKDEILELDSDKRDYCSNLSELKDYWRGIFKYRTLVRYVNRKRVAENKQADGKNKSKNKKSDKSKSDKSKSDNSKSDKSKGEKSKPQTDAQMEETARKGVRKSFKNMFNRLQQTYKKDALSLYLNSLIAVFDPHSNYLPPLEKETFDMNMSGSFEGIGAVLTEDDGYVGIASIIPGGPSWKQKGLQAGDKILKVAQGENEAEDIVGVRVQDAVKLIRGKKGTVVKLTVKKPEGMVEVIPILRDVVLLEETFAKSAVVTDKERGRTFGYIFLPKFYNDFTGAKGRSSTGDVAKEIEKLKKKQIDGLILDLRSNTGGALTDAVGMSGLFFPEGPVVQVRDKRVGIKKLDDKDPKTQYDGPMIVLVNTLSASASEILAAALQDYGRAVIVGSKHSFGKGTVQVMVNLDRFRERPPTKQEKSLGALSITIQKYYRVNGTSIQNKGVVPDIHLPDRLSFLELGEKHLDFPLECDSIPAAEFTKWSVSLPGLDLLQQKSKARVDKNSRFKILNDYMVKIKKMRDDTLQHLNYKKMIAEQDILKLERKKFEKAQKEGCKIKVAPSALPVKNDSKDMDKVNKERQKEWFEALEKDFVLKEAMAVLADMVDVQG
ncbi:MAG: tail-specific protease, partial [bacterium]|nr:tail-specific protease [bacterium]